MNCHKELLDSAAKEKYPEFSSQLTTLLENPDPEKIFQPEGNKGSPLIPAAKERHYNIVSYILKKFEEVLKLDYTMTVKSNHAVHEIRGVTALWCAALGAHIAIVRELL
ncbi:hypothetical protein LOD99_1964 [Oopsacas minuta]|uniref:Uncharacterized protein n=1 Tax=Oopsacas minuta TaxID=111878 RepID=A0AAV7K4V4_9METZ|nr:hypothetical protein LOD99_1964 [Oopsacas minuta]